MKSTNKIIIGIVILAFLGIGYFLINHKSTIPVAHKTFKQPLNRVDSPEGKAVENFYRDYLNTFNTSKEHHEMDFSKSFAEAVQRNKSHCKVNRNKNCLFGTERNVYLNSIPEEIDPKLNFDNSNFRTVEPKPGIINVTLNVYPSRPDREKYYFRFQQFKMIDEDGKWVVDDMLVDGVSAKKLMAGETKTTTKE